MVMPVIIRATGIVTKGLKKNWKPTRKTFNRFAIRDIVQKVLQSES